MDLFSKVSNENNILIGIPSLFESLKIFNHYKFITEQKLQINLIFKTWVHMLDILFCDQIQFCSIFFETQKDNFDSKNTIYEEDNEHENITSSEGISQQNLEEINVSNPIKSSKNINIKRKKGFNETMKRDQKFLNTLKGVSFKDVKETSNSSLENEKNRARPTFDRSLTIDSELLTNESFDAEFMSSFLQAILNNLNDYLSSKELMKMIYNKYDIRFFNEDLLDDDEV